MSDLAEPVKYSLYYSQYCFYCQKVLMILRKKSHQIKLLDVSDREHHRHLVAGGGKGQVPCLRIDQDEQKQWLYESSDILKYIQQHKLLS